MALDKLAKKIRRRILKASFEAKACHIGSALSCVEILIALYFKVMKSEDVFIFSKASGGSALYSVLAEKGVIPEDKIAYYLKNYPLPHKAVPGVIHSVGSIGHGLSVAAGIALGNRKRKVYVLMSDGEMDEGSTWEAILFAAHHKLDNLVAIVDYNKHQAFGRTNEVLNLEPLEDKWRAFNWKVASVDGHDIEMLKSFLETTGRGPCVLVAHTIKGKGVSFMKDKTEWHYKNLTKELYEEAIRQNTN